MSDMPIQVVVLFNLLDIFFELNELCSLVGSERV